MFQIKIHPIELSPDILVEGRKNSVYNLRKDFCEKYRSSLMNKISERFQIDEINETLYLKFSASNDKIKKDYSYIKNPDFKNSLTAYIEEIHSGIGFVF